MAILNVLLNPILPVFAIMVLGFVLGRRGTVTVDDARLLNRVMMTYFMPVAMFDLVANTPIDRLDAAPILLYGVAEAAVFTLGYLLATRLFSVGRAEAMLLAYGSIFANNFLYVRPIAVLIYGEDHVLPVTAIITFDAVVSFCAMIIALQVVLSDGARTGKVLGGLVRNPILLSITAGLVWSFGHLPVPAPVQTFLNFNGSAVPPLALFSLGVVMSGARFGWSGNVASFTLIKLALFPACVAGLLMVFAPDTTGRDLYVLAAAGPAGAMSFSLALLYGVRTEAIAQVIIWTSLFTLFTLAVLA